MILMPFARLYTSRLASAGLLRHSESGNILIVPSRRNYVWLVAQRREVFRVVQPTRLAAERERTVTAKSLFRLRQPRRVCREDQVRRTHLRRNHSPNHQEAQS